MIIAWLMMLQMLKTWYLLKAGRKENNFYVKDNLIWTLGDMETWPWRQLIINTKLAKNSKYA